MSKETKQEKIDKEILELYNFANCQTMIECDNCHTLEEYDGDAFDCIDAIHEDGWRVVKEKCLCKKCLEKVKK